MSGEPRAERLGTGGGATEYTVVEVRVRFRFEGHHTLGQAVDAAEGKLDGVPSMQVVDAGAYRTTIGGRRI